MDLVADVAVSAGSMVSRLLILTRCKSPLKSGAASVTILTIFWPLLSVSCVTIVTWYVVTATETICSAGSGGSAAWLPAPGQQSLRGVRGGKVVTSRDQLSSPPVRGQVSEQVLVLVPGAHKHFLLHVTNILWHRHYLHITGLYSEPWVLWACQRNQKCYEFQNSKQFNGL